MVEAVLFDFDGVMTDGVVKNDPAERLAASLGIPKEQVKLALSAAWTPYMEGVLEDAAFWRHMEAALRRPVLSAARNIWITRDMVRTSVAMYDLVAELQARDIPVGLLSNATPTTAADLRAHGLYDPFNFAVISSETRGLAKPDPRIFEHAMTYLPGIVMSNVVFVDDMPRNLDAAAGLGMQTVQAQSTKQIITDVRTLAGFSL